MWERVWQRVSEAFDEIVQAPRVNDPQLWCQVGRQTNEAFPFWAYASLGHARGEEDVILSLSFRGDHGAVECTCDIALGDGQMLAELPEERTSSSTLTLEDWVMDRTDDAIRFFKAHDDMLRTTLVRGAS